MHADTIKLRSHVGYKNAAIILLLLDEDGKYYFIEVNARLQVEYTTAEKATEVDLVQSRIDVAVKKILTKFGLSQKTINAKDYSVSSKKISNRTAVDSTCSEMEMALESILTVGRFLLEHLYRHIMTH